MTIEEYKKEILISLKFHDDKIINDKALLWALMNLAKLMEDEQK